MLHSQLPTLGVCLGMQLLFDESEEGPGWGWESFPAA
jgi:imidazoleglycerol phosphate synthase glutamine amidotransferase subunit HisH